MQEAPRRELQVSFANSLPGIDISQFFDACSLILSAELEDRNDNTQYRVDLAGTQLGPIVMSKVMMTGGIYRYQRDTRLIAATGLDLIFVQIITEGSDIRVVNGQEIRSRPGDVFIVDLTRTLRTRAEHCGNFSFVLPRMAFGLSEAEIDHLHGRYLPADSMAAQLVHSHIRAIWNARASFSDLDIRGLTSATAGLIGGFVEGAHLRGLGTVARASKYLQICQYIDLHLADADLDPTMLSQRFNLSRAALYRLFSETDGVANYIRDRRLRHAFRNLFVLGRGNIASLGFASGYRNPSSFIRAFKAKYGMTPGEALERTERETSPLPSSGATLESSVLHSWIRIADRSGIDL